MTGARRPTATTTVLGAVALGLLLAVTLLVVRRGAEPVSPTTAGAAPRPVADQGPYPARPLVWAEGRTLHLGPRSVDTGQDLLSLDVTDDGVAFTTFDGVVWFTDGGRPQQIGATLPARAVSHGIDWGPFGRPDQWVVSDNAGSRLAWLEVTDLERLEVVVYDTRQERVVAQVPVRGAAASLAILSVGEDRIYWTDDHVPGRGVGARSGVGARVLRYDVSSGRRWRVPVAAYLDDVGRRPRMLRLGTSLRFAVLSDGVGQGFAFVGSQLQARGGEWWDAWDAATGVRLRLRAPPGSRYGYGVAERLELVQWLDDDTFALLDSTGWNAGVYGGEDLLVCRRTTGRCRVEVARPPSARRLVVPEYGTPGVERATALAARASAAQR